MLSELRERIAKRLIDSSLERCSRWAEKKICLPKPYPGPLRFNRFPWIKEILDIDEGVVTVKKASQLGLSVAAMVKALHLVCENNEDVAYILPTASLVSDFSKGRLEPILSMSPDLTDLWVEANVGFRKTASQSSMYLRGSQSEAGLISVPLGHAVIDEYDRCNIQTMAMIMKRFSAREAFYIMSLSTPTLPEFGIDAVYQDGTQELFMFRCPGCNRHITLKWPESVEICGEHFQDLDCARSYYKCSECGHRLPHETKQEWLERAFWQATVQVQGHRSFYIPQMFSPGMTAEDIVREYLKGQLSEIARIQFMNQTIGQPYLMEGARLTDLLLDDALARHSKADARPSDGSRMICMGVDVGTFLDVWIDEYRYTGDPGNEPYLNSEATTLWEGRIPSDSWHVLDNLMAEWQIRHACVDFQPETQKAKEFARRFPGFVSLVQYRKGTTKDEIKEQEDENRVVTLTVNRTGMMDLALGRFHKGTIRLPNDLSATARDHLKAPMRTYEMGDDGAPRATYVNSSDDHLAHSRTFSEVAHFQAYHQVTGRTIKPGEKP